MSRLSPSLKITIQRLTDEELETAINYALERRLSRMKHRADQLRSAGRHTEACRQIELAHCFMAALNEAAEAFLLGD